MKAACLFRSGLHYRREAFCVGLAAAGYQVVPAIDRPQAGDVVVIWNRYGDGHEQATRAERAGGHAVVAENGYLGKSWRGGEWFSLALGHHAGAGAWTYGGPQRWDGWGVALEPWREGGKEPLILAQRGIGEPGIASPANWAQNARKRLGCGRIRPHPGKDKPAIPLAEDVRNVSSVITWASSAALSALMLGVPVYYEMLSWIGRRASLPIKRYADTEPLRDDTARLEMFRRLAWAMWTLDEIASGMPFVHLLGLGQEAAA